MSDGPQGQSAANEISNRQIFLDSVMSISIWLVIALVLAVLLWWASSFLSVPDRGRPSVVGLAGVLVYLALRFIKRSGNIKNPTAS